MIQAFIMKRVAGAVIKKVMAKRAIKKMQKYVEQENELDVKTKELENANAILSKELDLIYSKIDKYGKYIEELDKKVATLSKDSHSPIFGEKDKSGILKRLTKLEKGE